MLDTFRWTAKGLSRTYTGNLLGILKEFTCFKEGEVKVKSSGATFIDYTFLKKYYISWQIVIIAELSVFINLL